jgi:uncharacterized membrane protein
MNARSEERGIPPRLELFSDAVFAIIITIMVLELHPPEGSAWADLRPMLPTFFAFCVSFLNLILNWQNHHHLLRTMSRPTGKIMWANSHLLFWTSLIPFATAWFGKNLGEIAPTVVYATIFLLYAVAYLLLQRAILLEEGRDSVLAKAIGKDLKGRLTLVAQVAAVLMAFVVPWLSIILIIAIALFWSLPEPRIERQLRSSS